MRQLPIVALSLLVLACSPASSAVPPEHAGAPSPASPSGSDWQLALAEPAAGVSFDGSRLYVAVGQALQVVSARGEAGPVIEIGEAVRATAADEERLYYATESGVFALDPPSPSGARGEPRQLAEGSVDALAAGYGLVFAARAGSLVALSADGARTVAEGLPERATALLANGGSVVVGAHDGLHRVTLSTGEVAPLAAVGAVLGLSLDHAGYYAVSVAGGGLVRVSPDGEVVDLEGSADALEGALAFDAREGKVVLAQAGALQAFDFLALTSEDRAAFARRAARPMAPFTIGRYSLSGAEYWPNRGVVACDYPADVLWGFYPEQGVVFEGEASLATANPAAVACAERSYQALREFLSAPPPELAAALNESTSARFYLWVNDYSEAAAELPYERRPGRFWYWQRDPAVVGRVPGYWKWETTLTQDGECQIPDPAQALEYLRERNAG